MAEAAHPTASSQQRAWLRPWLAELAIVACVLGALVVYVAPTLDRPLLEKHAFRQTQTAYTARVFHEQGIDLLHPKLPVLGEPFEVPFEFPLFQAAAALAMDAGVADDTAMRTTGLACFLLTALLLFGLVRHVAGRVSALGALVAFALSPFALVWSRTSMIEYLATAGGVGFAWATIRWRESRRPLPWALALAAGLVGMLVKPTTAIFWIAPALLYRPARERGAPPGLLRSPVWGVVLVAAPVAAALLWTRHADTIKAASPMTEWLTSENLEEWNFGTLGQRFELHTWSVIGARAWLVVALGVILLPLAALAGWRSSQRRFWLGIASAAVLPPLVFTNLYVAHDYYLAAISPALAALIGLGAGYWSRLPARPAIVAAAVAVTAVLVVVSLELGRSYWLRIHGGDDDGQVLPLARELERLTEPDDRILVAGLDWSPAVLYYANRRGLMTPPAVEDDAYAFALERRYPYLLEAYPGAVDAGTLSRWPSSQSVGPHVRALGYER